MENLAVIRRSTWKTTVFVEVLGKSMNYGWVIFQPCLIPFWGAIILWSFFSNCLGSTPGIWGYNYD
jgi:hypothetical protein